MNIEFPKNTPLKRVQKHKQDQFHKCCHRHLTCGGVSPRHPVAKRKAARFSQLPQWCPIVFQIQKVTWCRVTGHLMYGYKFFMLLYSLCVSDVCQPVQAADNSYDLMSHLLYKRCSDGL